MGEKEKAKKELNEAVTNEANIKKMKKYISQIMKMIKKFQSMKLNKNKIQMKKKKKIKEIKKKEENKNKIIKNNQNNI